MMDKENMKEKFIKVIKEDEEKEVKVKHILDTNQWIVNTADTDIDIREGDTVILPSGEKGKFTKSFILGCTVDGTKIRFVFEGMKMTANIDICFSECFSKKRKHYFPDTDEEDLQRFIKEEICRAMNGLNCIGNAINLRKVCLCIKPSSSCSPIAIDLDASAPDYETIYIGLPSTISLPCTKFKTFNISKRSKDLVQHWKNLQYIKHSHVSLSYKNLIHELGHLQDAQRKKFGYTGENEKLHCYIDVIWNILLNGRLSRCKLPTGGKIRIVNILRKNYVN